MTKHPFLALAFLLALPACGGDAGSNSDTETSKRDEDTDASPRGKDASAAETSVAEGGARDASVRDARSSDARDASKTDAETPSENGEPDGSIPEPTACDPSVAPTIPPLALETVVSGLSGLTFAAQPPGSSDWYLLQQKGQIRVFKDGALSPTNFLDLSSEIPSLMTLPQDERGLLGLAFPPDYAQSGKFYVMLTPTSGPDNNSDIIREYTRSAADPYVADPTSKKDLIKLAASAFNHDGGNLVFGPDGMLYAGTGDGGGSCNSDKRGAPQNPDTLFGKILRLDPSNASGGYAAAGNPFASDGDARVLHYGLRNPYRFSFDRATGDLYIGDVGQDAFEELDFAPSGAKGLNFGWPAYEGKTMSNGQNSTCAASSLRSGSTATAPIADFDRRMSASGDFRDYKSIIGGHVYRGSALPELKGVYFFGDFVGARLGALRQCGSTTSKLTPIAKKRDPNNPNQAGFSLPSGEPAFANVTSIVTDNAGELYLVANFDRLYKVVPRP